MPLRSARKCLTCLGTAVAIACILSGQGGALVPAEARASKPNIVFILMEGHKGEKSRDPAVYDLDQRRLIDAEITRRTIDFLITDPKEEYPTTALRNSWNAGPAMKIVAEFESSLKKHPPIKPGTPDPYTPPSE
jgi:hypothetical protein